MAGEERGLESESGGGLNVVQGIVADVEGLAGCDAALGEMLGKPMKHGGRGLGDAVLIGQNG